METALRDVTIRVHRSASMRTVPRWRSIDPALLLIEPIVVGQFG